MPAELVSIHAPAWGATGESFAKPTGLMVSIHAPAWGATEIKNESSEVIFVSIHAPAWGATAEQGTYVSIDEFQSTLPHGERPI